MDQWQNAIIGPISKPDKNKLTRSNYQYLLLHTWQSNGKNGVQEFRELQIKQNWGINVNLFLFLKKKRLIHVETHNELSNICENSLPQRSVLSVTLFLIAVHDIFLPIPKPTKHVITIVIYFIVVEIMLTPS